MARAISLLLAAALSIGLLLLPAMRGRELSAAGHGLPPFPSPGEQAWASFHIWDRTQRGVFPKGTFEATAGPLLSGILNTVRGAAWWRSAKHVGFIPGFVADVDAVLAKDSGASVEQ